MRKRILGFSILLIITGIAVTSIFNAALSRYFYKYEVENSIKNTAILLTYQIEQLSSISKQINYDKLAKEYAQKLNEQPKSSNEIFFVNSTRITIIDYKGNVLGESDTNKNSMENHLSRKEIQDAIHGQMGIDQRFSETMGLTYVYLALPIPEKQVVVRVSIPLNNISLINKAFFNYTLIGILVGLLLASFVALRLSHIITDPINEFINTSKEIASGNYKKRVAIKSKDELGQLASTFNEMAEKLDDIICDAMSKNIRVDTVINSMRSAIIAVDDKEKIILINPIACDIFGIQHGPGIIGKGIIDITRNPKINSFISDTVNKNVEITDEIAIYSSSSNSECIFRVYTSPIKALECESRNSGGIITLHDVTALKKLEQIRTEFVSNVTHELKTPLTSIKGFVETLRSGAIDDPDVAIQFLDIIDIEAERLYMLINDILQLSEIEGMQKDNHISEHNLKAIIDEVLILLKAAAEKKNISLIIDVPDNIRIYANKDRIKQMLINLIDNAINYNTENGKVVIHAEKSNGKLIISIKDTGIGIPKAHQVRVFERFYRVDKGRSRNMGGTGLGLSIVKHIVNLYSGDIRIISEPGSGSEFIIQLPI